MSFAKVKLPPIIYLYALALIAVVAATHRAGAQTGNLEQQYADAQRALDEGKYSDAEQALKKLRECNPAVAEIHANLGLIYFQEKKFEQAIPEFQKALDASGGDTNELAAQGYGFASAHQVAAAKIGPTQPPRAGFAHEMVAPASALLASAGGCRSSLNMKNVPSAHTASNARTPTAPSATIHRECRLCIGRTGSAVIFRSDPLVVLDIGGRSPVGGAESRDSTTGWDRESSGLRCRTGVPAGGTGSAAPAVAR